jgi:hypothetical protein
MLIRPSRAGSSGSYRSESLARDGGCNTLSGCDHCCIWGEKGRGGRSVRVLDISEEEEELGVSEEDKEVGVSEEDEEVGVSSCPSFSIPFKPLARQSASAR